jgi:hypothetical protein
MPTYYNLTYTPTAGGSLSATSDATAIGLLYTDAHLAEWRDRALNGPYKSASDSFDPLIPGEWDRIVTNKDLFVASPTADRVSSYNNSLTQIPVMSQHRKMLDAAFYALVKEDSATADLVVTELLWHANAAGMQISPTTYQGTDDNWLRAEWLKRIVTIADFVKDSFTAGERTTFNAWLSDWAYSYEGSVHTELSTNIFSNRYNRDYVTGLNYVATSPQYDGKYAYKDASGVLHNQIARVAKFYNNRRAHVAIFFGLAGIFLDDATLTDRGKLYFEEWLQFSVYPDGSQGEYERNVLTYNVNQGAIQYASVNINGACEMASALATQGDNSLFTYSTSNGLWDSESTGGDPAKTVKLTVETFLDLIEHEKLWYHYQAAVSPEYLLDGKSDSGPMTGYQWVYEIYFAPVANRYWKDDRIKQGYMRTATGSIAYSNPIGPAGSYGGPWNGPAADKPSLLFMFSEMETVSSTTVIVNTEPLPFMLSTTSWQNANFGTQSGTFSVEYDAVPHTTDMDGVTGLSQGNAAGYSDLAIIVRFGTGGTLDVRNGGVYASDQVVAYTAGVNYHFRVVANTTNHTYNVFVTPNGLPEVLLASNYAFRSEQSSVPSLDTVAVTAGTGSHTISNFSVAGQVPGTLIQTVAVGTDAVPVTATPDAEFGFVNWTGDHTGTENPLTITNVQADMAITANFAGGDQTLTYTAGAGGSLTGTTPQTVAYGSNGTAVTAVPDANYSFVDWSDSSTQNPRTDTSVSGDVTVTANFTIDTFTLAYSSGANGSLTGTTPQTVDYNTSGTAITAVPEAGFIFVDWSDSSTDNPRTDANVTANISVSASFIEEAAEYTVTFAVNGGTLTGDVSQLVVSGADCTAVTVVPNANYSFTQWNDANTDNPRTVTNVTSNQALTATCVIDTYSVDFTAGAGGSITGTASQTIDHGSDATQVTGTAATDYEFTAWSGDYVGATNPLTITNVTANMAIAASFTTTIVAYTASTLSVSATSANADGTSTSTLTVQVKEDGVNATSGGHTVALVEDGSATISSVTDNSDGTYTATITNATVESVTVSGTVNTEAMANTKAVAFTSGVIVKTRLPGIYESKVGGC